MCVSPKPAAMVPPYGRRPSLPDRSTRSCRLCRYGPGLQLHRVVVMADPAMRIASAMQPARRSQTAKRRKRRHSILARSPRSPHRPATSRHRWSVRAHCRARLERRLSRDADRGRSLDGTDRIGALGAAKQRNLVDLNARLQARRAGDQNMSTQTRRAIVAFALKASHRA